MGPSVRADPLRRLDLLPCGGIEAVPVVRVGVALARVSVSVVVSEDGAVALSDDAGVVAVLDRADQAVLDLKLLVDIDEEAMPTFEASKYRYGDGISINEGQPVADDLAKGQEIV